MTSIHEPRKRSNRRRGEASGGPVAHEFNNTCVRGFCNNDIYSSGLCKEHYDYTIADILENLPELKNRFPGIEGVI